MTALLARWILLSWLTMATTLSHAAISTTKHNLSVSGPGAIKAASEPEICVFCHAPHNTAPSGQLWNRAATGSVYTPYTSSTLRSAPGQPNGASLLCLSCHDGTIALGKVSNRASTITMMSDVTSLPAGTTNLGTDLSDDHPVSFVYDAALVAARGELVSPAALAKPSRVRLDDSGQMQCTACHEPHNNANGKFLTVANTASALCQTCHLKNYWPSSSHKISTKTWNGAGANPWPHTTEITVAANACESCHRPHTAGGGKRLLNHTVEESNCYSCHNGNVAAKNVQSEFGKFSIHHVANYVGVHDPIEAATPVVPHVECVDCHNPHATNATAGSSPGLSTPPTLPGSLTGVRGVSISGLAVNPATAEYEICFRCHGDGAGNTPTPRTPRVISQNNKRLEFQTTNPSYHPLAGAGRSATVPSLIAPWTTSSRVKCTDCHNNDAGPYSTGTGTSSSGSGVNGPHGSNNSLMLERAYSVTDNAAYSASNFALCYKCHSETSIYSAAVVAGSFSSVSKNLHNVHLASPTTSKPTTCNVCHDPHGISGAQGNTTNNSRLINFQTGIVTQSGMEAIRWERVGANGGRCYLTCHGQNHNPFTY